MPGVALLHRGESHGHCLAMIIGEVLAGYTVEMAKISRRH